MKTLTNYIIEALTSKLVDGGTMWERLKKDWSNSNERKRLQGIGSYLSTKKKENPLDSIDSFIDKDKLNNDFDKFRKSNPEYKDIKFYLVNSNTYWNDLCKQLVFVIMDKVEYTPSNIPSMIKSVKDAIEEYTVDPVGSVKIYKMSSRFDNIEGKLGIYIKLFGTTELFFEFTPEEYELKPKE